MATRRQGNWLGQQRVDVADLRSVESGVAADFDILAGKMIAGRTPLVVRGFTIATTNVAGTPANQLQLYVAAGLLLHFGASEAGTLFVADDNAVSQVLSASNSLVQGTFTAGSVNYVGLDFRRSADTTTSDLKQFLDATTLKEVAKTVPTARTLQFAIVITTQPFSVSSNICPIAKVQTDSSNNVVSVTDARQMMFRLGSGGDVPNATSSFAWASRIENPVTYSSGGVDPFSGADKSITSLKQWMDAVMTRLWEVGSGEHWYSPTARDRIKVVYGQPVQVSTGDNFAWNSGTNTLTWSGISALFENASTAGIYSNTIQDGSAVLTANGQCLYVDLDRSQNATVIPAVGNLQTLGSASIPGSRVILAWRQNNLIFSKDRPYEVSRALQAATTSVVGVAKLSKTPTDPASPTVLTDTEKNAASGVATLDASRNVIGVGVTRDTAGTLSLGAGANDSAVTISKTGATTTVAGSLTVTQGLNGLTVNTSVATFNAGVTVASGNLAVSAGTITASGAIQSNGTGFVFPDSSVQATNALTHSSYSVTPAAGATVNTVKCIRTPDGTITFYMQVTLSAPFAAGTDTIVTLQSAVFPTANLGNIAASLQHTGTLGYTAVTIRTDGVILCANNLVSGDVLYINAAWSN